MTGRRDKSPSPQTRRATTLAAPAIVHPGPPGLEAVTVTDVGSVRPHNEDFVDCHVPTDPEQLERKGAIYLVADGMGGHQSGEVASQGAVEVVIREYYGDASGDVGTSLVRAVKLANRRIHEQAQSDSAKAGMGTTLVAAVVLEQKVYVANVGDSRAYLISKADIIQITEDHSWVDEQVRAGLLTPEQARKHPQRSLVTRALGSRPSVDVDLFEGRMGTGDMLLLCTDGLTGHLDDLEIGAAVREHTAQEALGLLVAKAIERGGTDNITVLLFGGRIEKAPMSPVAGGASRRLPIALLLIGAAVVLVLLAATLLLPAYLLGPAATPTSAPTLTPTAMATSTESISPTEPPPQGTTAPPVGVTVTPVGRSTPAAGAGVAGPTETLAPTPTPTPTPTPIPESSSSQSTAAKPTGHQNYPTPILLAPEEKDAVSLHGKVTFKWSYPQALDADEAFQVLIWQPGKPHNGAAEPSPHPEQVIDLDMVLPQRGGTGDYSWTVVIVRQSTEQRLSPEAAPWRFTYIAPEEEADEQEETRRTPLPPPAISPPDIEVPPPEEVEPPEVPLP